MMFLTLRLLSCKIRGAGIFFTDRVFIRINRVFFSFKTLSLQAIFSPVLKQLQEITFLVAVNPFKPNGLA